MIIDFFEAMELVNKGFTVFAHETDERYQFYYKKVGWDIVGATSPDGDFRLTCIGCDELAGKWGVHLPEPTDDELIEIFSKLDRQVDNILEHDKFGRVKFTGPSSIKFLLNGKEYNTPNNKHGGLWERPIAGSGEDSFDIIREHGIWRARRCGAYLSELGHYYGMAFSDKMIAIKWADALATFVSLKSHWLAVAASDTGPQYMISTNGEDRVYPYCWVSLASKASRLSPSFKTEEDVIRAIKDIGEDKLLQMFKTFQGIYE